MKIKIFKNAFIQELITKIGENIEQYRSGDFSWILEPEHASNVYELEAPWFNEDAVLDLNSVSNGEIDQVDDARDAKTLYHALQDMPPELARDPRIWTTLCHTHCPDYIRKRNHKFINSDNIEDSAIAIKSRFFIENATRSFERTNSLARLWWFGYLVKQTELEFDEAIDTQLTYTDFRAGTIERPDVFSHKNIRTAVLDVAVRHRATGDDFFKDRNVYRAMFSDITERATRVFFPGMNQQHLTNFVEQSLARLRSKGVNEVD